MYRCKIIHFFFYIFPLKSWQSFLIRRHIQNCPDCQRELAGIEEVRSLFIRADETEDVEVFWPSLKAKFNDKKDKRQIFLWPRLRWITGVACLFAAIIVGVGIYLFFSSKGPSDESLVDHFKINYIRVENKPAKAFLFRPHDSKMIIIWAEKNS